MLQASDVPRKRPSAPVKREAPAAPATPSKVLDLQRVAGNAAVARSLHRRRTLQRVLNPHEVGLLTPRAQALYTRLTTAKGRIPATFISRLGDNGNPAEDRIREATNAVRNALTTPHTYGPPAPGPPASPGALVLDDELRQADAELSALESFLDESAALLQSIHDLYSSHVRAVPAAGGGAAAPPTPHPLVATRAAVLALEPELPELARKVITNRGDRKELAAFLRRLELLVIPDNQSMQRLRATNAQHASEVIGRLIDGGLVRPGTLQKPYKSPYDKGRDKFGAAWTLEMHGSASGKGQWLREWEYHIHGEAVRAMPGAPVTGFTVTVGHIKPSSDPKALGVSIDVTNAAFINQIVNDYQRQFVYWANSDTGSGLLALKD